MSEFWRPDDRMALENDHPRLDVTEKVTGRAKYSTDYYPDKLIWAAFIRCPYGVAKLTKADVDAAKAVEGVLDVTMDPAKTETRYCGDRIGTICAESRQAIEDGIVALKLAFDIGESKTDVHKLLPPKDQWGSFQPPAPPAGGRGGRGGRGAGPAEIAAVDELFKSAHAVVEATYETQVQTHCCLEVHNVLVDYRGDHAVAWGSSQGTFQYRDQLTRPLELPADKVEFHCEYVGGGFGSKLNQTPEGVLAAQMSKKFNRPCRVLLTRKEEQLDTGNRPGSIQYMKFALKQDGTIAGGRVVNWGITGAMGGGGDARNTIRYALGTVARTTSEIALSAGAVRPMRAPGAPQGAFGLEMMMEEAAAKLGLDPLEFRIKNDPDKVRQEMYKVGAELIGWKNRKASKDQKGPVKTGYGVASGDWGNGNFGAATVTVNIYPDGTVEVLSGCQDIGQGFRTMIGDCVATTLSVPADYLSVKVGVSNLPQGPASGGSSTSRQVAPRAFLVAQQARDGILALVAKEWKFPDASKLKIENGIVKDDIKQMTWKEACKLIGTPTLSFTTSDLPQGMGQNTSSQCVQFAIVEVDTETGIVRVKKVVALQEVGKPVNRNTIENQITGAVIEGIGYALFEDRVLNAKTGVMNNANLEMYKCPGSVDIPEIVPVIWRSDPNSPVNAVGEPPSVPIAGLIGCAIYNAIGVPVRKMPMTPRRILAALGGEKGAVA